MNKNTRTDFLAPKSSFLTGMGSILNIAGSYYDYNYSKSNAEDDFKAIKSDWQMIGNDMQKVIESNPLDGKKR